MQDLSYLGRLVVFQVPSSLPEAKIRIITISDNSDISELLSFDIMTSVEQNTLSSIIYLKLQLTETYKKRFYIKLKCIIANIKIKKLKLDFKKERSL